MGGGVIFFPNYAATDREQSYLSFCPTGPQAATLLLSGRWENTAAIATITLQPGSSGFCDGSIFELEAIGDISGWTGNVMGLDDPAEVLGVEKANIETVMGVEAG